MYREDWRDAPMYATHEPGDGRYFFQRWYDTARVDELVAAVPALELASREVVRMAAELERRLHPGVPLARPARPRLRADRPRGRKGADGDVVRLAFVRR